jgi:hypothetical protein
MAFELQDSPYTEFFRPLVSGWLAKIEGAGRARSKWKEYADECVLFYSKSAAAMWDDNYAKKFWKGVQAPKFRITLNKAFEYVAIQAPSLLWDIPHRNVDPKKAIEIPEELLQDPQLAPFLQQIAPQIQLETGRDKLVAHLMQAWLNYTPREMPGGGLECHNELAVIDGLLKGRGCLWTAPYSYPASGRTLTGSFRSPPEDLLTDPDFNTFDEAKWIARKHTEPHWQVERRFKLPPGSLKGKATLESSWSFGEYQANEDKGNPHRKAGLTNDLVVWYEIWSKTGAGARLTNMHEGLKGHLEETVGDYAYIAVCGDCPYPLNCPSDKVRGGMTDAQVKEAFSWPIPLWADDRWPVDVLDFYPSTDSAWPLPPLAPAMGELKFLNFLVPWLANRIYTSSRDFWAVLGPHYEHYQSYLEKGLDQTVIPMAPGASTDDVRKAISVLQQPETRFDVWKIIELVSDLFDKRTGLTESAYGRNEDGTQNRTAEETAAKTRAVGVRPEYMQKKVLRWQCRVAATEAFVTRWFVKAQDTVPLLGQAGAMLWQQFVESTDVELVARQMNYTVAAASIRRPDRNRDISNFQTMSQHFAALVQAFGEMNGDFTQANGMLKKFGELHDMDMSGLYFPAPQEPDQEIPQLEKQKLQAETMKLQADAQKTMAEAQANPAELKMMELAMEQKGEEARLAMEIQKMQAELQAKMVELQLKVKEKQAELQMKAQEHQQDMAFQQQQGQVDLAVKKATGAQQIQMGQQQMAMQAQQHRQQMAMGSQQHQQKVQQTKQQSSAKVQAIKAQAQAKPKPATNGAKR